MRKSAQLSHSRKYRYTLNRIRDSSKPKILFIGLNPSTADETKDDATIRRLISFTELWGYGGFTIVNLFAFRAKESKEMIKAKKPIGIHNDRFIRMNAFNTALHIACWGAHGSHLQREKEVMRMIKNFKCFGLTKNGYPKHPLYLKKSTELVNFNPMGWR